MARSRAEVGRKIGCTGEYVRLIEQGKRTPSAGIAIRAAILFNTNPWQLLSHFGLVDKDALEMLASQKIPVELPEPRGGPDA